MKNNWHKILILLLVVFLIGWVVFVITPKFESDEDYKKKIEAFTATIKTLTDNNVKLQQTLNSHLQKIEEIDENINNLKNQETVIKEIYYEKIKNVDKLTVAELDSFFAKRYGN